ncbi:MAG: hypothetical protein BWY19_00780 [bacterium ADurb.Bin212]|nr:MAG: hypothetical protein BWY19_00780 [bacterium ADurb.Bin212]
MIKKWETYIDKKGLIVAINETYRPEHRVQYGDTLQRCGMWFLFSSYLYRLDKDFCEQYLQDNFQIMHGWESRDVTNSWNAICFRFYKMYQTCYYNEKTKEQTRYPIRHPSYEFFGPGKTSRDQMMSNLWALLLIASSDTQDTERQRWAGIELMNLWKKLKQDWFVLPANDILAPEHLSVFWRFFYYKGDWIERVVYKPLIWLGDLHSVLSTLVKIRHAKKYYFHTDDPNRICMLMGANIHSPTFLSKLSIKLYLKYRPSYFPKGEHYHGKPNSDFDKDPDGIGAMYAMKYYSEGQEAPWDDFFEPIAIDMYMKVVMQNENI